MKLQASKGHEPSKVREAKNGGATSLRHWFQRWWQSRLPLTDSVTLTQRNVYILPTRPGLMMGFTLLVLLVASINYQLNLGYLLTFLLAGTALASMHVCHGTLRGLAMNLIAPRAQFAGSNVIFDIKMTNNRGSARHGIGLSLLGTPELAATSTSPAHWTWTDVPAQASSVVQVAFAPARRGLQRLPVLTAETRFPLGTFRVWAIWRPAAQVMIYPAPEASPPPLPPGEPRAQGAGAARRAQSTGEFDGVRAYQRGDPLKSVLWKKAAKADELGNGLVVRDTEHARHHELWLDFKLAGLQDLEARLSRLCAWVLLADLQGLSYGMRLPGQEIKPGSGDAHKRQCLEALATC